MADTHAHNPSNSSGWTEQLIEVLDRQQTLADRLSALARQQQTLIDEQRTDDLLSLLAERQSLVDAFIAAQEQFSTLTTDLDQRLDGLAPNEREDVRSRIGAISERLSTIMHTDQQDQQRLQSARSDVLDGLGRLGSTRKAHNAYRTGASNAPRFADQQG